MGAQGSTLLALREDNEIRQRQLAAVLGIAQNTYSQYETGKIAFTDEMLIKLENFYGTSVDYLLDRTKEKRPYPR
ncbi:MAG: helix-turn-helix domain-containing protein [Defluviitaleaceae bacterium]|nr:helix-turn-helix domain-containing protein [Defluviitaleaceae bacterium]